MSVPASSTLENEDAVACGDGVVVVVDGAGLPAELRAGCSHSVAWFARSVAETFHGHLTDRSSSMRDALAETIAVVGNSHRASCRLADGSPSATVAAWRITGDQLEYLVLCDASVTLVDARGGTVEVTDRRLAAVLEAAGKAGSATTAGDRRAARRAVVEDARNQDGGFWCVHHDPAAAAHAIEGRVPVGALSGVVACSDGGTRAYEVLGTHTLTDFAQSALRGDGSALVESIRQAENAQVDDLRRQGLKLHDDLTIVAQPLTPDQKDT